MPKVKKVLSIDMDYIMGSCIQLYNDCVGSEQFENANFWEKMNQLRDIDKFLEYDRDKYIFVIDLFSRQLVYLDKDDIFFGKEHDSILEFLCGDPKKKDEIFDIYNVDHHHDLYYNPTQKSEVDRFDFACLADWVYYLGKNDKIHKYYWARNEKSDCFRPEEEVNLAFPTDFDTYFERPERLREIDFDYVFVCKSAEYFPLKFHHLFESLRVMASGIKKYDFPVHSQPYCIDGKSRPILK